VTRLRFLTLELKNFKPYYEVPGETPRIVLFDKSRKERNISVNVGPTNNGKTSISEAIMWCLYGEEWKARWSKWVNLTAIADAKAKKQDSAEMKVSLMLELDGDSYEILRTGEYRIDTDDVSSSDLSITDSKGIVMKNPEKFIGEHFPTAKLMEYFIFDVDDFLKKFDADIQKGIKSHIEKFAEIEKLNGLIESLGRVEEGIEIEIDEVRTSIPGDEALSREIKEKQDDIKEKENAVKSTKAENLELDKKMKGLFSKALAPEEKRFFEHAKNKQNLQVQMGNLNREFIESGLSSKMDLAFMCDILNDAIDISKQKATTKSEFHTSSETLRSALGKKFRGIVFGKGEEVNLIRGDVSLPVKSLAGVEELPFASKDGGKTDALHTFYSYQTICEESRRSFLDYRGKFQKIDGALLETTSKLELMGGKTKDKDALGKFQEYERYEKKISENLATIRSIEEAAAKVEKEAKEKLKEQRLNQEQKDQVEKLRALQSFARELREISTTARNEYLERLLEFVNKKGSSMLRSITSEPDRWNSIEVHSDFKLEIKDESGHSFDLVDQVNKGNLQLSLMCFVFSLPEYLNKDIPFVLDNPLIRLDAGHNMRLVEQLSKMREQLVLHLIPGNEYSKESFGWLKGNINTQNWICREKLARGRISKIEEKSPNSVIEYDKL
jgi:hypothetical protein